MARVRKNNPPLKVWMYPVAVDATQLMFGTSVGPTATVIGPGVHIFDRDPITGDLTPGQILRPRPAVVGGGFGAELALAQDVLAVAANVMTLPGSFSNAGEVNLFRRTQGVWQLEAVLHSPTPGFLRLFGQALAITPDATSAPTLGGRTPPIGSLPDRPLKELLDEAMAKVEREAILGALKAEGGSASKAARRLGVSRAALYNKVKRHNIPM